MSWDPTDGIYIDYIPPVHDCYYRAPDAPDAKWIAGAICRRAEFRNLYYGNMKGANKGTTPIDSIEIVKVSKCQEYTRPFITFRLPNGTEIKKKVQYGHNQITIDCWQGDGLIEGARKGYIVLTPAAFDAPATVDNQGTTPPVDTPTENADAQNIPAVEKKESIEMATTMNLKQFASTMAMNLKQFASTMGIDFVEVNTTPAAIADANDDLVLGAIADYKCGKNSPAKVDATPAPVDDTPEMAPPVDDTPEMTPPVDATPEMTPPVDAAAIDWQIREKIFRITHTFIELVKKDIGYYTKYCLTENTARAGLDALKNTTGGASDAYDDCSAELVSIIENAKSAMAREMDYYEKHKGVLIETQNQLKALASQYPQVASLIGDSEVQAALDVEIPAFPTIEYKAPTAPAKKTTRADNAIISTVVKAKDTDAARVIFNQLVPYQTINSGDVDAEKLARIELHDEDFQHIVTIKVDANGVDALKNTQITAIRDMIGITLDDAPAPVATDADDTFAEENFQLVQENVALQVENDSLRAEIAALKAAIANQPSTELTPDAAAEIEKAVNEFIGRQIDDTPEMTPPVDDTPEIPEPAPTPATTPAKVDAPAPAIKAEKPAAKVDTPAPVGTIDFTDEISAIRKAVDEKTKNGVVHVIQQEVAKKLGCDATAAAVKAALGLPQTQFSPAQWIDALKNYNGAPAKVDAPAPAEKTADKKGKTVPTDIDIARNEFNMIYQMGTDGFIAQAPAALAKWRAAIAAAGNRAEDIAAYDAAVNRSNSRWNVVKRGINFKAYAAA